MTTKSDHLISFYKHIGKLFYAIAACDKNIEKIEFETLKSNVYRLLTTSHLKLPAYHVEHYIISSFINSYHEGLDPQACFDAFILFKKHHDALFTNGIKQAIMKIAGLIASSFSKENKSELIMLAKLNIAFKKTS